MARPLEAPADLDPLLRAASAARVVLLGEATHGTREFYQWRAILTQRLIAEQGVRLVAVEGDWRSILEMNAFLRGEGPDASAAEAVRRFDRWPRWMWANAEFAALLDWVRDWNRRQPPDALVQVHGLDLYGHEDSLKAVEDFVREWLPDDRKKVRSHYGMLRAFGEDGQAYAQHVRERGYNAQEGVAAVLEWLRNLDVTALGIPSQRWFEALQDAHVVERAERFYRTMVSAQDDSWNVRAEHMWLTLQRLLEHEGRDARAIVWAHNTHVGDARATDMARAGMLNIGQLARERLGADRVFLVGFATYEGEVVAGSSWGARHRVYRLPSARDASWDEELQQAVGRNALILFDRDARNDPVLLAPRPQRAVGVVFDRRNERSAHYTQTILPRRFDALLFVSRSRPVAPLR